MANQNPSFAPVALGWANAVDGLSALYGPKVTPSRRETLQSAPRNKFDLLEGTEAFFNPQRPRISWVDILSKHLVVVLNTGSSAKGINVSHEATAVVTAMAMYGLKRMISSQCAGWGKAGKSVTIFADELSLFAKDDSLITWFKEQGRSFGVRPFFATQFVDQLVAVVKSSFLGFLTLISFAQENPANAACVVADFGLDGSPWEPADIAMLPLYHAAVRTKSPSGGRLSVFTVSCEMMPANEAEFRAKAF
jgi:hypothetical protein